MSEFMLLAPPFAAGLLLGALFFGGLWWTVIKGVRSQRPALWFFGSLILRLSITLEGFYFGRARKLAALAAVSPGFVLRASRREVADPRTS